MTPYRDVEHLTGVLAAAGFVAAAEEAVELLAFSLGDEQRLAEMVERRLSGEPLAWITGRALFCGTWIRVHPGVYVPRPQSEALVRRAAERLPRGGAAVDVCCGSGALAKVLALGDPTARVVGLDVDPAAVACAAANLVEAYEGDLFDPLPAELQGRVDVVAGVVPYVPSGDLALLQRDTLAFEDRLAYDGGEDGTAVLRRVVAAAPSVLRPGGALLLEIGGDEADAICDDLARHGFGGIAVHADADGDVRAVEATLG